MILIGWVHQSEPPDEEGRLNLHVGLGLFRGQCPKHFPTPGYSGVNYSQLKTRHYENIVNNVPHWELQSLVYFLGSLFWIHPRKQLIYCFLPTAPHLILTQLPRSASFHSLSLNRADTYCQMSCPVPAAQNWTRHDPWLQGAQSGTS